MARRQCLNLGPDVRLDAGVAEQLDLCDRSVGVSAGHAERFPQYWDQTPHLDTSLQLHHQCGRRRDEVPGGRVHLFQYHGAARTDQAKVGSHLLCPTPQRGQLEPRMHQVKGEGSSSLANRSSLTSVTLPRLPVVTNCSAAASIASSMSVPTTSPPGPTHSLSRRSHPIELHPTSRARAPTLATGAGADPARRPDRQAGMNLSSCSLLPPRFPTGVVEPIVVNAARVVLLPRTLLPSSWLIREVSAHKEGETLEHRSSEGSLFLEPAYVLKPDEPAVFALRAGRLRCTL